MYVMAEDRNTADRGRAVEAALANIEKKFGKGSIMRLGEREVSEIVAHGEHGPAGFAGSDHPIALRRGAGHRFFDENMDARGEQRHGQALMQRVRGGEQHRVDPPVQLFAAGEGVRAAGTVGQSPGAVDRGIDERSEPEIG